MCWKYDYFDQNISIFVFPAKKEETTINSHKQKISHDKSHRAHETLPSQGSKQLYQEQAKHLYQEQDQTNNNCISPQENKTETENHLTF